MELTATAGKKTTHILFFLYALIVFLVSGCTDDSGNNNQSSRGNFVAYTSLSTVNTTQTNAVFQYLTTQGLINASASYDVKNYKIRYKTIDINGNLINASGLLSVPIKSGGSLSPIISYQHGTIFLNSHAPSNQHTAQSEPVLAASLGYIVSSPDYIGYGDSSKLMHPYSHSKTLASSSIDMLRAAKVFLEKEKILTNNQLFLMGYSEGGKATLAMQRVIETSLSNEFQLTASAPGAGNYDMTATANLVLSVTEMVYPAYVAWIIKAYNDIYNINRLSDIIAPQYLDAVSNSFDGTKSGDDINAQLTTVISELIKPAFINEYIGNGAVKLKAAIADNNDYNWAPDVPTRLFHGLDDRVVHYFNSSDARDKMIQNGSTSVQLVDCDVGVNATNHSNCYFPYLGYVYSFFSVYADNL